MGGIGLTERVSERLEVYWSMYLESEAGRRDSASVMKPPGLTLRRQEYGVRPLDRCLLFASVCIKLTDAIINYQASA